MTEGWGPLTPEDEERFFNGLTPTQLHVATDLISGNVNVRVTLRRVVDEASEGDPLAVHFSDGRRYLIAPDGTVTEYPE